MASDPRSSSSVGDKVRVKLVVVGDGAIGKTCLLIRYTKDEFPDDYVPTVFDNYADIKSISFNPSGAKPYTRTVHLDLWDTAGQEEFDRIRPLSYRDAHFFIVCFSVVNNDSFEHVISKWVPEVRHHCPDKRFILVGTKADLRSEVSDMAQVSQLRARQLVSEIQAECYVECSAMKNQNVNTVFETAIKRYLEPTVKIKKKKTQCLLM